MKILSLALFVPFFVIANFLLWRKLREEYKDDEIMNFSVWITAILFFGSLISKFFTFWYSLYLLLIISGILFWSKKNKWDYWEIFDIVTPIGYFLWSVWEVVNLKINSLFSIFGLIVILVLAKMYRRIRWYKSGKTGFVFLSGIIIFSIWEIGIAFSNLSGIYWGSFILSYAGVAIYMRSGRKLKEDLWLNRKNKQ